MKKKRLLPLCIVFFISHASRSQDSSRHLSLQEAISASALNNDETKLSQLDEQIARAKFRRTDAIFLPQVEVSYAAVATDNSLNAFGFKLQQRLIDAADFNPKLLNNPSPATDFSAKIEFLQPLVNLDRINERKAAGKQIEMYRFISRRTAEYLSFESEKAYLQLQMLYDVDKVLQEAHATSKAIYQTSKHYFEQGLIQRSDLLNAELHVTSAETQLNNSRSNIRDASDHLSILMGKPIGTVYTTDPIKQELAPPINSLKITDDRPDFRALEKGIEAYDKMISSAKNSYLPRLNAFGSFQQNDKAFLSFNSNSYIIGINLSWKLFNGNGTKNMIAQQSLEKDKLARQLDKAKTEAEAQLAHAKRQLSDAVFSLRQQQMGIAQASEALRVLQNRYAQGLVTTNDVLMAHTQLSQQQLSAVEAVFNYNLATVYLRFLTTKTY
ncbi:MAG TPA: TolC family protein [Puia sp.]|uniref:TolC family protein n=1 Tax=Puia sp. TaxID=2045100 RepID=UPI002C40C74A|nr:TolC family protein [Puia sp.]HVU98051.1 TolC family protein [Puia sp.]